nr:hypothetical protein [Angustibacter aerolatus]
MVLSVLDRKWREHLYEMDYLQEGIGLRAMAQRDPLVEYQREGFQLFNAMNEAIKEESVGYVFNLEVQVEAESEAVEEHPQISAKGLDQANRPAQAALLRAHRRRRGRGRGARRVACRLCGRRRRRHPGRATCRRPSQPQEAPRLARTTQQTRPAGEHAGRSRRLHARSSRAPFEPAADRAGRSSRAIEPGPRAGPSSRALEPCADRAGRCACQPPIERARRSSLGAGPVGHPSRAPSPATGPRTPPGAARRR